MTRQEVIWPAPKKKAIRFRRLQILSSEILIIGHKPLAIFRNFQAGPLLLRLI
jgi:hypothetical protein